MKLSVEQLKKLKSLLHDPNNPSGQEIIVPLYGENGGDQLLNDLFDAAIRSKQMIEIGIKRGNEFIDAPETNEPGDRPVYVRLGE